MRVDVRDEGLGVMLLGKIRSTVLAVVAPDRIDPKKNALGKTDTRGTICTSTGTVQVIAGLPEVCSVTVAACRPTGRAAVLMARAACQTCRGEAKSTTSRFTGNLVICADPIWTVG